jgi:hypothetical protein
MLNGTDFDRDRIGPSRPEPANLGATVSERAASLPHDGEDTVAPVFSASRSGIGSARGGSEHVWRRDGEWSGWRVEAGALKVRLGRSDPSPLFVAERAGEISLSQNLLTLLERADLTLDADAISAFLHLGFFLDDRTPFQSIRAVLPGDRVTLDASGLRWQRDAEPPPTPCELGLDQVTDAFIEATRRAVASAAPPERPFVHPLSGGRDSRLLLLEMKRQGRVPRECVTLAESPDHPDAAIARQVSLALGIPHRVLKPDANGFEHELVNVDATHLCADEHNWLVPLAQELRRVTPVVFDGLGGGVLYRAAFADAVAADNEEQIALEIVERFRAPSPSALQLAGALLGCKLLDRSYVVGMVAEAIKRFSGEPNPVVRFVFTSRTWREVALVPRSMYRGIETVHTPLVHPEVTELARSLPASFFAANPKFQDHLIATAFPEAAHLPYVEKDGVFPPRALRPGSALSRVRRSLWWRRHLDASDRALARRLEGDLKRNRLTWLLMLKAVLGSDDARRSIQSRAVRALGRVALDVAPGPTG